MEWPQKTFCVEITDSPVLKNISTTKYSMRQPKPWSKLIVSKKKKIARDIN